MKFISKIAIMVSVVLAVGCSDDVAESTEIGNAVGQAKRVTIGLHRVDYNTAEVYNGTELDGWHFLETYTKDTQYIEIADVDTVMVVTGNKNGVAYNKIPVVADSIYELKGAL